MRLIMLDTETTGVSAKNGDRMVEIGAVELCPHDLSVKSTFHKYINPDRPIPPRVVDIHGIDDERVKDEPKFHCIAQDFLDYIAGGTLVIHNARFDLGFISHELALSDMAGIHDIQVIDTLEVARFLFPKQRNSLDALCDRFEVERGHRVLHGALLDSELLAEVYIGLTKHHPGDLPVKTVRDYIS